MQEFVRHIIYSLLYIEFRRATINSQNLNLCISQTSQVPKTKQKTLYTHTLIP